MSQTIATPSATNVLRRWGLRVWNDPQSRSTAIGIERIYFDSRFGKIFEDIVYLSSG